MSDHIFETANNFLSTSAAVWATFASFGGFVLSNRIEKVQQSLDYTFVEFIAPKLLVEFNRFIREFEGKFDNLTLTNCNRTANFLLHYDTKTLRINSETFEIRRQGFLAECFLKEELKRYLKIFMYWTLFLVLIFLFLLPFSDEFTNICWFRFFAILATLAGIGPCFIIFQGFTSKADFRKKVKIPM
jgi:hypothetical protein